jgi:phosphopantetheinyl transferase
LSDSLKVGIDIECIHDRILKIRSKFVAAKEDVFLKEDNFLTENLILIWSAKEALFKMDGKGNMDFRKNISIKPFHLQDSGFIMGAISKNNLVHEFPLSYQKIQDHMMVFVTTPI